MIVISFVIALNDITLVVSEGIPVLMLYFRYTYDITQCMFSCGNVTEKMRVAEFDCRGETVVDLYAGVKAKHMDIF